MKRFISVVFILCLMLTLTLPVSAEESGVCGEGLTWKLEGSTLTISGSGAMYDFPEGTPWDAYKDTVTKVVLTGGVTYIGQNSFKDFDALTEVNFGSALTEIGPDAFNDCDGLTSLSMPASFKIFGERSFQSCSSLKEFHCAGRFPKFKQNCLWDTYAIIYYPAAYPWNIDYVKQLTEAFHGRIKFLASDGTDPLAPEETTAPTTAATTEPTTEPTTLPTETTVATTAPTEAAVITTGPASTTQPATFPTDGFDSDGDERNTTALLLLFGAIALIFAAAAVALAVYQANERKRRARRRRTPGKK